MTIRRRGPHIYKPFAEMPLVVVVSVLLYRIIMIMCPQQQQHVNAPTHAHPVCGFGKRWGGENSNDNHLNVPREIGRRKREIIKRETGYVTKWWTDPHTHPPLSQPAASQEPRQTILLWYHQTTKPHPIPWLGSSRSSVRTTTRRYRFILFMQET